VALNFGKISEGFQDRPVALLHQLQADPTLSSALTGRVEETTLNKYPELPINPVLVDPEAQQPFFYALDELVDTS
jgi:hypothetical protein